MNNPLLLSLLGTSFSFLGTALGAAMVFLFRKEIKLSLQKMFLGFASGIMLAASFWSLLMPAMELSVQLGMSEWVPASIGFCAGGIFLFLLDKLLPHLHFGSDKPEGMSSRLKRTTMLVIAVTLHNIPEGMAVGLSFALSAQTGSPVTFAGALVLALGMALQNFPEGTAISLPLLKEGFNKRKSFACGALSGIVEPISGVLGALLAFTIVQVMPFMLAFAAGAMIYVVVDELVPQAYNEHSNSATLAAMVGFVLMMVLDVAFG